MAMNGKSGVRKMLSKEECEIALENAVDTGIIKKDWNVLNQLIEEHFKLKEKYSKILDDVHDYRYETHCMKMTVINLCEHFGVKSEKELQNIYLSKPYKFEDLKPNMWVYDGIEKLICQIGLISKNAIHREYVDGTISDSPFEENRFFPVQCANLEIEN